MGDLSWTGGGEGRSYGPAGHPRGPDLVLAPAVSFRYPVGTVNEPGSTFPAELPFRACHRLTPRRHPAAGRRCPTLVPSGPYPAPGCGSPVPEEVVHDRPWP